MLRRSFLKLMGGLAGWLIAKPRLDEAVAKPVLPADHDWIVPSKAELPEWCPKGWIPMMGQVVTQEQFPYLFTVRSPCRKQGMTIRPKYYGREKVVLPTVWPDIPNDLQANGWQDNLTRTQPPPAGRIVVHVMSTEPLRWSNGTPLPAGTCAAMVATRDKFEQYYGPIPKPNTKVLGDTFRSYNGYETIAV